MKTKPRTPDKRLLSDQEFLKNPYPGETIPLLVTIMTFYQEKEYELFNEEALTKVYHGMNYAKSLREQLHDPYQTSLYNGRVTPLMKESDAMFNTFKFQIMRIIEHDYMENKDFDIIELYFRFQFVHSGVMAALPGTFPYAWEGKCEYCDMLRKKLLRLLVRKIQESKKLSKKQKYLWYTRLSAFYTPGNKTHAWLESLVPNNIDISPILSDSNLFEIDYESKAWNFVT